MIPWVTPTLHALHDVIFGASETGNPWIDHPRHAYHDADHLLGLVAPILTLACVVTLVPYYAVKSVVTSAAASNSNSTTSTRPFRTTTQSSRQWLLSTIVVSAAAALLYLGDPTNSSSSSSTSSSYSRGLDDLITGVEPRLHDLLQKCPLLQRGPDPPVLLTNRHLQFIPWILQNLWHYGMEFERHHLNVTDCLDKTTTSDGSSTSSSACVPDPSMTDEITLDVFPPFRSQRHYLPPNAPVVLLAPGLTCHSQDLPSNSILRALYGKGLRSIVVNRRGHTPGSEQLRAPRFNLFGDVSDLEQVYWHVKEHLLLHNNTPMFLHGISSGSAVVVSALAAWDKRRLMQPELPCPSFVGAVSVTPGYDIAKVMLPERFKWPYNAAMTESVKEHFLVRNEALLRAFNNTAYDATMAATSLQQVLNASTPFSGYPSVDDFYKHVNPINDVQYVTTPLYILNSVDDPCCHVQNLYERSLLPQHRGKSYAELIAASPRGIVAVAKTGSHCPFLDGKWYPFVRDPVTGGIMLNSWADQSIAEFYSAALEVYDDRRFL